MPDGFGSGFAAAVLLVAGAGGGEVFGLTDLLGSVWSAAVLFTDESAGELPVAEDEPVADAGGVPVADDGVELVAEDEDGDFADEESEPNGEEESVVVVEEKGRAVLPVDGGEDPSVELSTA